MTTISSSKNAGISLTPAFYTSPVVIGAGVTITNPAYPDIVYTGSGSTTFFVVQNYGTISGTSGTGVYLAPGGSVTNASGASIVGTIGVNISGGTGTVLNDGSIAGGVALNAGGSATNGDSGSISGGSSGVAVAGGTGVVVNYGSIMSGSGRYEVGIRLTSGGSVSNRASGLITGGFPGIFNENINDNDFAYGIVISGGAGGVINYGTVGVLTSGFNASRFGSGGIFLEAGGSVTNELAGSVTGANKGVYIAGGLGTVVNDGLISAYYESFLSGHYAFGHGVVLDAGGLVTNAVGGTITGAAGGVSLSHGGTVVNDGRIDGIFLRTGGSVTNAASGSITFGVFLSTGGTLTNAGAIIGYTFSPAVLFGGTAQDVLVNAGTIIGNNGTAVSFGGTGQNLLVLKPGFAFSGLVTGGSSASNTLELASAASAGTVTGLGSQFLHFGSIVFDAGADWSITGLPRGLAGTISGFAYGDTIELTGVTATGSIYSDGVLTIEEASGSATLTLPGSFTTGDIIVTPVADGTDVSLAAPCFVAGTRIHGERGEVPVEQLGEGDKVFVHSDDGVTVWRPIVWIGRRHLDCRRHPRPRNVWPVRIATGAFGPALPRRDLWLSPDHAVFVDGMLIPIKHLINDTSITQVPVNEVTYYHVELPRHGILLVEGLPAESYLDTGDRTSFANSRGLVALHADFGSRIWEAEGCAPLIVGGPKIKAVRQRIDALAVGRRRARVGVPLGPHAGRSGGAKRYLKGR